MHEDLSQREQGRQHLAVCPLTPLVPCWIIRVNSESHVAPGRLHHTWEIDGPTVAVAAALHVPGWVFAEAEDPTEGPFLRASTTAYLVHSPGWHRENPWVAGRDLCFSEADARAELARRVQTQADVAAFLDQTTAR